MKTRALIFTGLALCLPGCSKPVAVEIADACRQTPGASVAVRGYVSLPDQIETIKLTRDGRIVAVGLQLYLTTRPDATGDVVKTTFWTSEKGEPNRIKPLAQGYTGNDLLIVTDDGKQIGAGKEITVVGEVKPADDGRCFVNASKIEAL